MFNAPQLATLATRVDDLVMTYQGMAKIDLLVLPLPYSQLLKARSWRSRTNARASNALEKPN